MKRAIFLIIILTCLLIASCSFSVPFVIENQSSKPISIVYKAKKSSLKTPFIIDLGKTNGEYQEWREMPKEYYETNETQDIIKATLPPNHALRVESSDPFWVHNDPYGEGLNIKNLIISGDNGLINLEGNQVIEQFKPLKVRFPLFEPSEKGYVIYYKESKVNNNEFTTTN